MCGRTVQTLRAVNLASLSLQCDDNKCNVTDNHDNDNFNLSPGDEVTVFQLDEKTKQITSTKKVWGLVPKGGTKQSPLPKGKTKHFEKLMFNARSETAYEKYTFKPLLEKKKICIIAIDGFYEWKMITKDMNVAGCPSGKQPYYVHRSDNQPLLIAGFYTSVSTGGEDSTLLHTFTIFTTNASPKLRWLHQRQPLIIWDHNIDLMKQWLLNPTKKMLNQMYEASSAITPNYIAWYPVSRKMSNVHYHGEDCIKRITFHEDKPTNTIKSFFSKAVSKEKHNNGSSNSNPSSPNERKRLNPYEKQIKQGDGDYEDDDVVIIDNPTKKIKIESSSKYTKGKTSMHSYFKKD